MPITGNDHSLTATPGAPGRSGTAAAATAATAAPVTRKRLDLYKAALKRSMRRVSVYRRRLRRGRYDLRPWDRMLNQRFNPSFLFPRDMPAGLKVLVVLPHHHEAIKLGGLIRALLVRDDGGMPRNRVRVVVVNPSHRSIGVVPDFAKREHVIDAIKKEALDWAHVIGLNLGVPPWDPCRHLFDPTTELPPEAAYAWRREGDQFVYGPDGAFRFFNAWRTYDSGENDPNCQRVDAADQRDFNACIDEECPDLMLLPDLMDPHPSHRTTRDMTMEALRQYLVGRDRRGERGEVTLLEYPSFHLLTPPRYNLWVVVPKDLARSKTEANKVFRLQKQHDYEMNQIMAERVVSMTAGDEFSFTRGHPEKFGFGRRLSQAAPDRLPANITAENFTVSVLGVVVKRGIPVVREYRVTECAKHFRLLGDIAPTT